MANISFPLTSSFVGEFLIFMGLYQHSFWATFFASTSMVLGAVYTLWTYNRIFFGNIRTVSLTSFKDLDRKEVALFSILIFALFLMGIYSNIFIDLMLFDSVTTLEHAKCGRIH
jgi:NADH:ubiquinone oxidoreductase subunit 4 (subunit M)